MPLNLDLPDPNHPACIDNVGKAVVLPRMCGLKPFVFTGSMTPHRFLFLEASTRAMTDRIIKNKIIPLHPLHRENKNHTRGSSSQVTLESAYQKVEIISFHN